MTKRVTGQPAIVDLAGSFFHILNRRHEKQTRGNAPKLRVTVHSQLLWTTLNDGIRRG